MSISLRNPTDVVTEQRLKDFYNGIYPYLGSTANAGFTPVGTIIAVMGNSAPVNYLACNGQVVNIKTYPELADYFEQQFGSKNYFGGNGTTTFGIPDLRGEFLRGAGTNSHANQGSGADVSVHQDATAINGWNGGNGTQAMIWLDLSNQGPINPDKKISSTTPAAVNNLSLGSTGLTSISFSTRPTNTSVLYCIATKNIYLNPSLDYSTTEKMVGTWIDGKPVYQKTIIITNMSEVWSVFIASEVDTLVDGGSIIRESSLDSNNHFIAIDNGVANEDYLFYRKLNNNLTINKRSSAYNIDNVIATVRYTKTTD